MDLDKSAWESGLRNYHPHYLAQGKDEDLVVRVTANGHAPLGDMERYMTMAKERGLVAAQMSVSVRRKGTRFLVEGYDLRRV